MVNHQLVLFTVDGFGGSFTVSQKDTKNPRDPITERQIIIGMFNHLLRKVFRFHYHSQEVIGSPRVGM